MKSSYILKLNNKCNMNCLFCADPSSVRRKDDPELKDVFEELKKNRQKYDSLAITGGEPTIYRNIFKVIDYAKRLCKYKRISIASNGLRLSNEKFLSKIVMLGIDSFQISYFALDKNKFSALARTPKVFDKVNKAIKDIIKRKKEVRINLVINKQNYRDLPSIVKNLVKMKVNSITLAFMNPVGDSVKDGKSILLVSYSEIMDKIGESFKTVEKIGFQNLHIENFPVCIARNHIDKINDLKQPKENQEYYNASKIKPAKCQNCIYDDLCPGTWKEYVKQKGGEDFVPITPKKEYENKHQNKLIDINTKEKQFMDKSYLYEIAGIRLGLKKASIFYAKKSSIQDYINEIERIGLSYAFSDFSFDNKDEKTLKAKDGSKEGEYSIYISKDDKSCRRLKYLDYFHQFQEKEPSGMTKKQIFMEIGNLLGYPKCCSNFLFENNDNYHKIQQQLKNQYEGETLYKLIAFRNSNSVDYSLNNFSIWPPRSIISFYPCSYNCKKALEISRKLIEYAEKEYPKDFKEITDMLKMPFIFFSAYRIIYFEGLTIKKGRLFYSGCFFNNNLIKHLNRNKIEEFNRNFSKFSEGNSFKINGKSIVIYKEEDIIHYIKKSHELEGIFVHPKND